MSGLPSHKGFSRCNLAGHALSEESVTPYAADIINHIVGKYIYMQAEC